MKILYCRARLVIFLLLIFVSLTLYFSNLMSYFSLENLQRYLELLRVFVQGNLLTSVGLYILIFVLATIFCLPVTFILTVLAGNLFGIVVGLLSALISATLGSVMVFLLVRYLFADIVQRRFAGFIATFKAAFEERGYSYLLMLQLFPIKPTPLINITAGLLPISAFTFAWTEFIGMFPGTLIYVIAGQQFAYITSLDDIFSWSIILILSLLAILALLIPFAIRYFWSARR